jgi:hypothetical protein
MGTMMVGSWLGGLLSSLVWSVVVEVVYVLADHGQRVALVVDQHVVGALVAEAASPAFDAAVRLWSPGWCLDHGDALGGEDILEGGGVLGVAVADEESEPVGAPA